MALDSSFFYSVSVCMSHNKRKCTSKTIDDDTNRFAWTWTLASLFFLIFFIYWICSIQSEALSAVDDTLLFFTSHYLSLWLSQSQSHRICFGFLNHMRSNHTWCTHSPAMCCRNRTTLLFRRCLCVREWVSISIGHQSHNWLLKFVWVA